MAVDVGGGEIPVDVRVDVDESVREPPRVQRIDLRGGACHKLGGLYPDDGLCAEAVHYFGKGLGRLVADPVGVGVDAGNARGGECAQHFVVVYAKNGDFRRDVDADFAADADQLMGSEVV